jgi:hypothetical protein
MKLAVYQYCDESQRQPNELSIRFAWCDRAPKPQDLVAMGDEATWQVADFSVYEGAGQITHVYAVNLYRETLPSQADWELYALKANYPEQSLQIQISDVGSEILGYEINFLGQKPAIGNHLIRYGIQESTFVTRREAWQVSAIEEFSSNHENVPFQQIYLAFHKVAQESLVTSQL